MKRYIVTIVIGILVTAHGALARPDTKTWLQQRRLSNNETWASTRSEEGNLRGGAIGGETPNDSDELSVGDKDNSPIGDAIPLVMGLVLMYGIYAVIKNKKEQITSNQ
jgi:hypothetical protein